MEKGNVPSSPAQGATPLPQEDQSKDVIITKQALTKLLAENSPKITLKEKEKEDSKKKHIWSLE